MFQSSTIVRGVAGPAIMRAGFVCCGDRQTHSCRVDRMRKKTSIVDVSWQTKILIQRLCCAGLVTTWSRAKVRDSAPVVKKEAFWKATIEGGLFCYMIPFNTLVAILICTTPGPSAWVKALKVVMSAPSLFFQFGWFMACRKFWQVIESGHGGASLPILSSHGPLHEPAQRDHANSYSSPVSGMRQPVQLQTVPSLSM